MWTTPTCMNACSTEKPSGFPQNYNLQMPAAFELSGRSLDTRHRSQMGRWGAEGISSVWYSIARSCPALHSAVYWTQRSSLSVFVSFAMPRDAEWTVGLSSTVTCPTVNQCWQPLENPLSIVDERCTRECECICKVASSLGKRAADGKRKWNEMASKSINLWS